jgi:Flp pilus assembly pilin Flp
VRFLRNEKGSILTEYGLLLVIVALSLIAVLGLLRDDIAKKFTEIRSEISGVSVKK